MYYRIRVFRLRPWLNELQIAISRRLLYMYISHKALKFSEGYNVYKKSFFVP